MALQHLKEYHCPAGLEEALALLRRSSVRTAPLAGGTLLTAHLDPRVEAVVDLSRLGLDRIEDAGTELRLGAMVRLDAMAAGALPDRTGRVLAEAARRQPSWQLRNAATLGGTLVSGAFPELDAVLWALDARVALRGESDGTVGFAAFLKERDRLPPGTLLTGVTVPVLAAGQGAAAARVSRTPADLPSVSTAAFVERRGDLCAAVRLVVTGAAERPVRMPVVEQALTGRVWSDTLLDRVPGLIVASVSPPADLRGSRAYRRAMLGICAVRALAAAWSDTAG